MAEEVKLRLSENWDKVFTNEDKYRMGYQEKEAFINKHKHLPHIPSGDSLQANGVSVSETMSGMLKNVEENTLDVISLRKKYKQLQQENRMLRKELKEMRDEIETLK